MPRKGLERPWAQNMPRQLVKVFSCPRTICRPGEKAVFSNAHFSTTNHVAHKEESMALSKEQKKSPETIPVENDHNLLPMCIQSHNHNTWNLVLYFFLTSQSEGSLLGSGGPSPPTPGCTGGSLPARRTSRIPGNIHRSIRCSQSPCFYPNTGHSLPFSHHLQPFGLPTLFKVFTPVIHEHCCYAHR